MKKGGKEKKERGMEMERKKERREEWKREWEEGG